jgi:predicted DNA-binding protein (MmcQ/YjbR family)
MNQADFDGTEAALMLMTVTCNFLSLFKQLIIGGNVRNRLKTLRHKMLAIPSIIEKSADTITVKMALHMNRRNWIAKVCDRIQVQFLQSG